MINIEKAQYTDEFNFLLKSIIFYLKDIKMVDVHISFTIARLEKLKKNP